MLSILTSVTQKHLAMPPSPRINDMLRPRSDRDFIAPRSTMDWPPSSFESLSASSDGVIIWLIRSKACWRSARLVMLNIVITATSSLV